jgi:hypothetical protein
MDGRVPERNGGKGMKVLGIALLALAIIGGIAVIWTSFANGVGWSLIALMGCAMVGLAGVGCLERSTDR